MKKESEENSEETHIGIVSFIFGVLSLVSSLDNMFSGVVLAILGITFSYKQKNHKKNSWAKWGFWLSITSLIITIALASYLFYLYQKGILPTS
jgi:amino acid transporter